MKIVSFALASAVLLAGCMSSGPVMDADPDATPVEAIAEPTDGIRTDT